MAIYYGRAMNALPVKHFSSINTCQVHYFSRDENADIDTLRKEGKGGILNGNKF
jgi:hypothetical protein